MGVHMQFIIEQIIFSQTTKYVRSSAQIHIFEFIFLSSNDTSYSDKLSTRNL